MCVCDFFFFSFSVVYGCSQARGQATATLEAMPSSYAVSHKKSPFLNQELFRYFKPVVSKVGHLHQSLVCGSQ